MRWVAAFAIVVACGQTKAQITWRRTFGGGASDIATSVSQTADGGYVVGGSTGSFGTGGEIYVVKLDENGERVWSNYFGGLGVEESWGVEELGVGGYLIAGTSSSEGAGGYDGYLIRVDPDGVLEWEKHLGSPDWDFLFDVAVDDSGYYLAGKTYATVNGGSDMWLVRTDLQGEVVWQRTFGGSGDDEGHGVALSLDGGCVIAGTMRLNGSTDAYLVKYSSAGEVEWDALVGTDSVDVGHSVVGSSDGGYVVGGTTRGFSQYSEMMLAKVDGQGNSLWLSHIGQIDDWEGREIRERNDGGFAMVGYTKAFGSEGRDVYLLLTNALGEYEFGTTYGGSEDDEGWGLDLTSDGGYVTAGSTESFGPGPRAMFVVKGGPSGLTDSENVVEGFDPVGMNELGNARTAQVFPNPVEAGGAITIRTDMSRPVRFVLSDGLGRAVMDETTQTPRVMIPALVPGIYHATITTVNGLRTSVPLMVR